ncbi:hypothetical protein L3X38_032133 [Prunus dulcis]|uniref:MULE transposase domain-containing protein n=1 Tax=Prunus dulcis TaxID=3755 RepID=A0AAD4YVM2_PRUDU|nr:hypothetical protein L3X38_032133 [Prunus dulcis]
MQGQDELMVFFGDMVVFDMTFNTNCYEMVFAPLLGEFKKAMPDEPPKIIIIDQDAAMSKAIVVTLPTTFHRYCIWHILNKFMEKPGIEECFSKMCKCIWGMDRKKNLMRNETKSSQTMAERPSVAELNSCFAG